MKNLSALILMLCCVILSFTPAQALAFEFTSGSIARIVVQESGTVSVAIVPPSPLVNDAIHGAGSIPTPVCLWWYMDIPSLDTTKGKEIYSLVTTAKSLRKQVWVSFDATSNSTFSACTIKSLEIL